jgi:zinc transporter, ZIP family
MDPILTVLLYSSLAAGVTAFGALPFLFQQRLPTAWIGWANALAAGMMLGAAYALLVTSLHDGAVLREGSGAVIGILFVYLTHAASQTEDLDLNRLEQTGPEYGYQVMLVNTLHSGAEGVAIGAAMLVSLPFGIFMALAIAIHNIPEATVLSAILTARGVRVRDAGGLAVATNVSQVLLAIVTFAIVSAAPTALPWVLGFAVGALIYLVMAELLPESYRQAGSTTIALVTIAAMGMVVLLGHAGA